MFNISKIIFLLIMMIGSMITISSNSWLNAWMGLEINLLAFIPLMSDNNLMSSEASMKYFLIQAMASIIFIFSAIMSMMKNSIINSMMTNNLMNLWILSSLLMKAGASPFHFWFPTVMEGISWYNSIILMTWQKIAPLIMISYLNYSNFMFIPIILSTIIGSVGGLNQTSLRKLMAYSSINHLSWMMTALIYNELTWILYFSFYSFLSFLMIFMFNAFKLIHMNQLINNLFKSKLIKFFLFMNLLSLGGLPPFMGFYPKWILIQLMINNNQLILTMIMVMTSLITLFFYMRLCYTAFMLTHSEINWTFKMSWNKLTINLFYMFSFISIFGFFLTSCIYLML